MKKTVTVIFTTLIGAASGAASVFSTMNKKINKWKDLNRKNDAILRMYSRWLELKQEGKNLSEYFKEHGYEKIAIYGMHYLGQNLRGELEDTDIEVKYAIDRRAENISTNLDIYVPDENLALLDEVDAVVVTAFHFYDEIEDLLSQYLDCPIISLEDVLSELEQ